MKITIEIENDEDIKKAEKLMKHLMPSAIRTKRAERANKIEKFLKFVDRSSIPVKEIIIPDREKRNARCRQVERCL